MEMSRANEEKTTGAGTTVYMPVCSEGRKRVERKPAKDKSKWGRGIAWGQRRGRGEGRVGRSVIDGKRKLWRYLMKWIELGKGEPRQLALSLPI